MFILRTLTNHPTVNPLYIFPSIHGRKAEPLNIHSLITLFLAFQTWCSPGLSFQLLSIRPIPSHPCLEGQLGAALRPASMTLLQTWMPLAMRLVSNRRRVITICFSLFVVFLLYTQWLHPPGYQLPKADLNNIHWANLRQHYPVESFRRLPQPSRDEIPKIQHDFNTESPQNRRQRLRRLQVVKDSFIHAFHGYEQHAWLRDEVAPLSGRSLNPFGGWAATLVDSLGMPLSRAMPQEQAYKNCRYSMDNGNEGRV